MDHTEITLNFLTLAIPRLGHCQVYLAVDGGEPEIYVSTGYTVGRDGKEYSIVVKGPSVDFSRVRTHIQKLIIAQLKVVEIELPSPVVIRQAPSQLAAKISFDALSRLQLAKSLTALNLPLTKENNHV